MSRFYGEVTGQSRTSATRRGSANSGIQSHTRGWNLGIRVEISDDHGKDYIKVYRTGGSTGSEPEVLIYTTKERDHDEVCIAGTANNSRVNVRDL